MRVQLKAWLPDSQVKAIAMGADPEACHVPILNKFTDMASEGWLCLGDIWIDVPPFPSREDAATMGIAALQAKLQKMRAEAELEQGKILLEISKLQSLTYGEPQP